MIELNAVQTVAFGGLALFLGYALCRVIPVLGRYNLPAPVIGGLVVALVVLWAHGRDTVLFQYIPIRENSEFSMTWEITKEVYDEFIANQSTSKN